METSVVQSMLRTTTESGDIGPFIPRQIHKPPTSVAKRPLLLPQGCALDIYDQRHDAVCSPLHWRARQDQGYSRMPPRQRSESSLRTLAMPLRMASDQDMRFTSRRGKEDRSWSMTQNSYTAHSPIHRKPVVHLSHSSPTDGPGFRPRSPYAYPTRLKRPGFRPSSPALSDNLGQKSGHRQYSPYHAKTNTRSITDPSFSIHLDTSATRKIQHPNPSPASSRPSTPKPVQSLRSLASSFRFSQTKPSLDSSFSRSHSSITSPLFYDYSEAYENPPKLSSNQVDERSWRTTFEDSAEAEDYPENYSTDEYVQQEPDRLGPTETLPSSPSMQAIELPPSLVIRKLSAASDASTKHSRAVNMSRGSGGDTLPEVKQTTGPRSGSRIANPEGIVSTQSNYEEPRSITKGKVRILDNHETVQELTHFASDVRDLSLISNDALYHSQNILHNDILDSSDRCEPFHVNERSRSSALRGSTAYCGLSTIFDESSVSIQPETSVPEVSHIISPTPERLLLSSSGHNRLSTMLGLDESILQLDELVQGSLVTQNVDLPSRKGSPRRIRESINPDTTIGTSIMDTSSVCVEEAGLKSERDPSQIQVNGIGYADQPSEKSKNGLAEGELLPQVSCRSATSLCVDEKDDSGAIKASGKQLLELPSGDERVIREILPRSPPRINKDLPRIPPASPTIAFEPPIEENAIRLPFGFSSVLRNNKDWGLSGSLVSKPMDVDNSNTTPDKANDEGQSLVQKPVVDLVGNDSGLSSRISRPWNHESNYPWVQENPDLEVKIPDTPPRTPSPVNRFARLRFLVQRQAGQVGSTARFNSAVSRNPPLPVPPQHFKSQAEAWRRQAGSRVPTLPGQINSSQTFEDRAQLPPSPGPHWALQRSVVWPNPGQPPIAPSSQENQPPSFFSDDSSHKKVAGGLRKRVSTFKLRHLPPSSKPYPSQNDVWTRNPSPELGLLALGTPSTVPNTLHGAHKTREERMHSSFRSFRQGLSHGVKQAFQRLGCDT